MIKNNKEKSYLPALKWHLLTPFYNLTCMLGMLGKNFRNVIITQVKFSNGAKVIDVGCGTGELAAHLKQDHEQLSVFGVDPDEKALSIAKKRLSKKNIEVQLRKAYADLLPFPDNSFDIVFCTLTLHHLDTEDKQKALEEMHRIAKPAGMLVVADFGEQEKERFKPWIFELREYLKDHIEGRIPEFINKRGFIIERTVKYPHHNIYIWIARKGYNK